MVDLPESPPEPRARWLDLHKSAGIVLGLFILVRLAWRLAHVPPAQYRFVPEPVAVVAEFSHAIVYALLVLVPLSGFLGATFGGGPARLLRDPWAGWGVRDEALGTLFGRIHFASGWTLAAFIVLHVSAALWHLVRRDGSFWRIFPRVGR